MELSNKKARREETPKQKGGMEEWRNHQGSKKKGESKGRTRTPVPDREFMSKGSRNVA